MLELRHVSRYFGGLCAVDDLSLTFKQGHITGVIGPNGAGKSTLFNIIAGLHPPTSGEIWFAGENISALPAHALFRRGILRTFQIAHEFTHLSVLENLMVVPDGQTGESLWATMFARRTIAKEEARIRTRAEEVLEFLNIAHVAHLPAGELSGGQKKLLELGRTMMVEAKLVLLDEVGAGVNRTLLKDIGDAIRRLRDEYGYTFIMIEHDINFIASLCDPIIVMSEGALLAQGNAATVLNDARVIESYLGKSSQGVA